MTNSTPTLDQLVSQYYLYGGNRSVENIKTFRCIILGQPLFHMNPREASAMAALSAESGRILALKTAFRAAYRGGPPLTIFEPDVRKRSSAAELTRLSRALCVSTVNLEDLIKRSNFFMLKAIRMFFLRLIEDEVVRRYSKAYPILVKEREFMREFVHEGYPGKQREALLKKLKEPDFILPRLFALYTDFLECEAWKSADDRYLTYLYMDDCFFKFPTGSPVLAKGG